MGIVVREYRRPKEIIHDGWGKYIYTPDTVCDVCGEKIKDANGGNYVWVHGATKAGSVVYFVHKQCHRRLDKEIGENCFDELVRFPLQMAFNMGINILRIPEKIRCEVFCC